MTTAVKTKPKARRGRPPGREYPVHLGIRVEKELVSRLQELAALRKTTVSEMFREWAWAVIGKEAAKNIARKGQR